MAVSENAVLSLNYFDAAWNAQNTMFFAVIAQLNTGGYGPFICDRGMKCPSKRVGQE